jgi:cell division protein FtsW (lipid II flippase)
MKLFWLIVAGVCIVVAGFFLLRRDLSTAFVVAALGLVAWFLNYRAQMKEVIAAADLEDARANQEESFEEQDDN